MNQLKTVCITLCIVLCYFQALGADKYTDENRPYEFGFKIDGEQHRHEKKDENGIIMGEFGFITADGVYHVTVYATDENGNFKIISMKNIRVKPYPSAANTRSPTERKGHSLPLAPPQQLIPTSVTSSKSQSSKQEPSSLRSCSHCKLPTTTTTTTPQPQLTISADLSRNDIYNKQPQITNNIQLGGKTNYQTYNNQESSSQYENPLLRQQSVQPITEQNYQKRPETSQSQQNIPNIPSTDQIYKNQAVNVNQEQYSENLPSQQTGQDVFNVGRKYLQKTKNQQQPSIRPSSTEQKRAEQENYQQGFNAEQQKQQGIIDGQYNLLPPHANRNDQQSSINPKYPQETGVQQVQEFVADKLGPNSNTNSNTEQDQIQQLNTNNDKNIQNKIYYNEPKTPSQTTGTTSNGKVMGDREPKSFTDVLQKAKHYNSFGGSNSYASSQQNNEKPVLIAAQMQVIDKNTNIYHKNPGENEGLPKGLTTNDMTELLYTFNYTVGFHGHHEEGYKSGAKIGYYYVTGRNGIRTRVDYVADETGFHPRISQEVLDIQSDEVPKPETEKDEKYGLKGYEFKWLYYPIGPK